MIAITQIGFGGRVRAAAVAWLAALALAGCSGSGAPTASSGATGGTCSASDAAAAADCGTALVSLTDAEGDFVGYSVDVLSLTLQRADGSTVEMLPATTRIDFAQLTDLSELVSAATLAPGDFVGGTIRLDYGNADIEVEAGGQVVQARAEDATGAPLGVVALQIQLSDRNHLVVTRARTAFLSLDFNLAASNTVDTSVSPPVVTVAPYIVGEVSPVDQKDLRVRGALASVDAASSSYTVHVRPWQLASGDHGLVTVQTTAQTTFEIGGDTYTGADGLTALAALPKATLTVARGTLDTATHTFTAADVAAGTSVGGAGIDAVTGSVVARSGDTLTVAGAWAMRHDAHAAFRRTVTVLLGPSTTVVETGAPAASVDAGAVSVGQRITAFGTFQDPASIDATTAPTTAATPPVLDATAGRVRLLPTRIEGTVVSVVPGQLDLALQSIDRLGADLFDFSGTGTASGSDADPADYKVATGTLSLAGLTAGGWTGVLGFVESFGTAPPDFAGQTVIDRQGAPATLDIGWGTAGTTAPFLTMEASSLVLDLSNPAIGTPHALRVGGVAQDLGALPASPSIVPSSGRALFGIAEPGHVELFADFGAFVDALTAKLGGGQALRAFEAHGSYDPGTGTLTATKIAAVFVPAN